ncbi:hypothetical protein [Rhizobium sophoriradicis]|uniref:SinR family protein n=1 Tax=Rhizobium sophoriradicis TaxID=1535245 RepID=A0A2A5KVF0_9HYPH|nr:hypothetical protein [Rhizobium sophoriradicis]PCK80983.1 hypothetical protein CPT34_11200 [Rhizobium sophoriradicis]
MAYNLFIAYDLLPPGQNYEAVSNAIMGLGKYYKFQYSLWYVHTEHTPEQAFAIVTAAMDAWDKLAVINAQSGVVTNWDHPPIDTINSIWHTP